MPEKDARESLFGSPGFVVSAIGIVVLLVAAIVVVVTSAGRHQAVVPSHPSTHRGAATRLRTDSTLQSANDPRGCDLPARDQSVPVSAPSSAWTLVGAMATPTAPGTLGPQRLERGVRVCFAHDPTGALFALASFFAESTRIPQAQLFTRLAADTRARAVAVAEAQGDGQLLQSEDGDPGTVSIAGFQYVDYTPAQASMTPGA